MSRRILRKVRDELASIRTSDIFVDDAIKTCIALCDAGLTKGGSFPPHQGHSDTSRAAAIAVAPKFGAMTHSVLFLLSMQSNGLTDEEGQEMMRMEGNSYRPCRVTLLNAGYVYDTSIRRLTSHKKKAVVWGVTQAGIDHLSESRMGK